MTGLGDRLREARTAKGYTLEDLQTITKIQKRYLSGIENEDYSMMPGSFYVRAFIKQYAEAVDIDPDEMLSLYQQTKPSEMPDDDSSNLSAAPLKRSRGMKSNKLNEVIPKVIVALFIVVIIVVVWVLYKHNASTNTVGDKQPEEQITTVEKNETGDPPASIEEEAEEPALPTDETEDVPEEEPAKQTLAFESANGEDSMYSLSGADEMILEISTSGGDSWIGVLDENRNELMKPNARTLGQGEQVKVDASGTNRVRIRVGRTSFTTIIVNGETLKYDSDRLTQNIIIERKEEQ